jgi:hypothetical protein
MTRMVWNAIKNLQGCERLAVPERDATFYVFMTPTDDTVWLVGPYKPMTDFATDLRNDKGLRDFLTAHRVRLGLRDKDVPPPGIEWQKRIGPSVPGAHRNKVFIRDRSNPITKPVLDGPVSGNRKMDREDNVKSYWASQTPHSHHIVEFNNLAKLGVSHRVGKAEMDHDQLPAVLLAAEFHKCYISSILQPAHLWTKQKLELEIAPLYTRLYFEKGRLFEPLLRISKEILKAAGI